MRWLVDVHGQAVLHVELVPEAVILRSDVS